MAVLFVAAASLFGQTPSPTPGNQKVVPPEAERLEVGRPVRKSLAGEQTHLYRIALEGGQFLHLVVDQIGVDIVVSLSAPDGTKLAGVDSPNYAFGPEPLSIIASASGDYVLQVKPSLPKAPSGSYEVTIRELRQPTDRDQRRASAQSAHLAAEALRAQSKAEALRESLALYEKARGFWREAGDPAGEARTTFALAEAQRQLGNLQEHLELLQKVLSFHPALRDPGFEAVTLTSLGGAYVKLDDRKKALSCFDRALSIVEPLGDLYSQCDTLVWRGELLERVGDNQEALNSFFRALKIARSFGDRSAESTCLNDIAFTYEEAGELEKALEIYTQALALQRAAGDRRREAITLNNAGRIYALRGDWRQALEYHSLALPLRRELGDRYGEAYTLNNLGVTQAKLGEPEKALENLRSSLELRRAVADRYGEATTLEALGQVFFEMRRASEALASFEKALSIRREIADPWGEAETVASIARVLAERGDLEQARGYSGMAVSVAESLRSRVGTSSRGSYLGSARRYYELDIDLLMTLHRKEPDRGLAALALAVSERSRARGFVDLLTEARADIRQGVDAPLLEQERSLRRRLGSKLEERSRQLAGKHAAEEAAKTAKEVDELSEELQRVESRIREVSPQYAALTAPQPLTAGKIQGLLDASTVLLEYSLGEERSFVWAVSPERILVRELPKRSEIEALARKAYAELTRSRAAGKPEDGALTRLSDAVLGIVTDLPAGIRLIVVADGALQIVPFGALPEPRKATSLISSHEVVNLPSASVLEALRAYPKTRTYPKVLAVMADPVFDRDDQRVIRRRGTSVTAASTDSTATAVAESPLTRSVRDLGDGGSSLPRLAFTRREARAIEALVSPSKRTVALDFKASRSAATREDLSAYRFVHFATHGILDTVHPELSGLVFSLVDRQGRNQEGFLPAMEVFNLRLPVELVVLSACQTGLGKEIRGEGIIGLTRAFMYAGAPRVVASLWRVDDAATAELMKRFYEGMLRERKLRPAAALREAQQAVSRQKRWAHPYYWAGFVLQGEWR